MTRKRLDPSLRFNDVIPVWEAVKRDDGGLVATDSDNETIALIYRLNQYRKIIREDSHTGWTELDHYVVRKGNLCVEIARRVPIDIISRMTKLDGTPLSPREFKPSPLDAVVEAMSRGEGRPITAAEQKELDKAQELSYKEKGLGIEKSS